MMSFDIFFLVLAPVLHNSYDIQILRPMKFAKVQQNHMQTQHKLGLKSANPSPTFCTFASLRQHCVAFTMVGGRSAKRLHTTISALCDCNCHQ
jgi:hypothetical protein